MVIGKLIITFAKQRNLKGLRNINKYYRKTINCFSSTTSKWCIKVIFPKSYIFTIVYKR